MQLSEFHINLSSGMGKFAFTIKNWLVKSVREGWILLKAKEKIISNQKTRNKYLNSGSADKTNFKLAKNNKNIIPYAK